MKIRHGEGVATHADPESCGARRAACVAALTGERIGQHREGIAPQPMMHGPEKPDCAMVSERTARMWAGNRRRRAGSQGQGPRGTRSGPTRPGPRAGQACPPGKRVPRAGTCTQSRQTEQRGTVHRAAPPYRHRSAAAGLCPAQTASSPRRRWGDVEGLRAGVRGRGSRKGLEEGARRPAPAHPPRQLSGATIAPSVHTQAGRAAAAARQHPRPARLPRGIRWLWWRSLRRRSHKDRTTRTAINRLVKRWLRQPRITHPWPEPRFAVTHPRWEPGAGMPHAGFCAAGAP